MSDAGRDGVKHAMPAGFEAVRWRLIAAVTAGFALVQACGGRAADVAEGEDEGATGEAGARALLPARPVGTTSPPPRAQPVTPPPREGESCYSPSRLAESGLASILPFLPEDAIDTNNCLASMYSGWLVGGGCNYDPRPAVVRGDRCCYLLDGSVPGCGRPLTIDGDARTAPVHPRRDWLGSRTPCVEASLPRAVAQQLAREWLADARLEHASVASFASFALSLLAVGAPPELLAECQRAGLDEVEHARACFALASRFAGEELGPGRLSLVGLNVATQLEELALRAWLEGCVEETVAALTASAQLEVATDEPVRSALTRIAADEARHAELSWKCVGWALASSGPELRHALTRAGERLELPPLEAVTAPDVDVLAQLHAHGRLSAAEQRAIRARALRDVIRPALDALLAAGGASVS